MQIILWNVIRTFQGLHRIIIFHGSLHDIPKSIQNDLRQGLNPMFFAWWSKNPEFEIFQTLQINSLFKNSPKNFALIRFIP